jgi:hypothetical protein
MEAALANPTVQRLTLVSGSHYPLWSPRELSSLAKNAGDVIATRRSPNQPDGSRPESEYERRFVPLFRPFSLGFRLANALVNRIWYLGRPLDWRAVTPDTGMRAGSTWWSLERGSASAIVTRLRAGGPLIDYFKKIVCVDEKVFATLYAQLHPEPLADGTTFAKWDGGAHPTPLTRDDIAVVRQESNFWFARKFSSSNTELLDWLDQEIAHPPHSPS